MEKILVGLPEDTRKVPVQAMVEREGLLKKLGQAGIPFETFDGLWPRDELVSFDGKVVYRKDHKNYADGGYVRVIPGFCFACSSVSEDLHDICEDVPVERFAKLQKLYGRRPVILPNPNYSLNSELRPHSDMIIFPVPDKKIMFVDAVYHKENLEDLKIVQNLTGLNLIDANNDYSNPSWPCNSLLYNSSLVITNSDGNSQFIETLKRKGLDVLATPFKTNCSMGGSVNCATNLLPV